MNSHNSQIRHYNEHPEWQLGTTQPLHVPYRTVRWSLGPHVNDSTIDGIHFYTGKAILPQGVQVVLDREKLLALQPDGLAAYFIYPDFAPKKAFSSASALSGKLSQCILRPLIPNPNQPKSEKLLEHPKVDPTGVFSPVTALAKNIHDRLLPELIEDRSVPVLERLSVYSNHVLIAGLTVEECVPALNAMFNEMLSLGTREKMIVPTEITPGTTYGKLFNL